MQPKPNQKCCGNCKFAIFYSNAITPTGKFKKDAVGRCSFVIEWPKVPEFLKNELPKPNSGMNVWWSYGRMVDDGKNCDCFELGKPTLRKPL